MIGFRSDLLNDKELNRRRQPFQLNVYNHFERTDDTVSH